MKLTRHARIEVLIVTGLALGSCDMPQPFRASDADTLDVAYRQSMANLRAGREMVDRVERLEERVEELERWQR